MEAADVIETLTPILQSYGVPGLIVLVLMAVIVFQHKDAREVEKALRAKIDALSDSRLAEAREGWMIAQNNVDSNAAIARSMEDNRRVLEAVLTRRGKA